MNSVSHGLDIPNWNVNMPTGHKYARIERERRFLVRRFPERQLILGVRRIMDRYIEGTNLRLREQNEEGQPTVFKLTQKIPSVSSGAQQGFVTTMYLDRDTHRLLSQLPGHMLSKVRYSVPPFGIDVFEGALVGLILAEAEFDSAFAADALTIPDFPMREVSHDDRFTGGRLARAARGELRTWLSEYGIEIGD
jgi:CYTH domain-containing protein